MNINEDFEIFVNASHRIFLKKHKNTNKIKTKFFVGKSRAHFSQECYDFGMCQNSEKNINV